MKLSPFLLLIFIFGSLSGKTQTTIHGNAEQWAGKTIRLVKISDPVSENEVLLDQDTIAADGSFSVACKLSKTESVWLYVKRYRAPLLAEPNGEYQIVLVPKPENQLVDTWLKGSFEYGFENLDSTDVNSVLGDFDRAYYNFYLDNAQLINSPSLKKKIPEFEKQNSSTLGTPFIQTYEKSTIAQMKLSAGVSVLELYNTYLFNQPVHPDNSAWYDFFDLFYADYFQNFDARFGGATMVNRLKSAMTPDSLYQLVDTDPFLANDTLKQWVLLKSVNQVYESGEYPLQYLDGLLDRIKSQAATPRISEVAARMKSKITNPIIGMSLDSLSALLESNPDLSPEGKYTLLMVSTSGNIESEKEKRILQTLKEKYSSVFQVIEVEIDAQKGVAVIPKNVYRPKDDYTFLEKFQIYSIPYFMWIGPDGKIAQTGIEKPSKGLEKRLYKIQVEKDQGRQIKVGQ